MASIWEVENVDKENLKTRTKLKEIGSLHELKELINNTVLTDEERTVFWMIYRDGKPIDVIADSLGMSVASVHRKHSKILRKIGKMLK